MYYESVCHSLMFGPYIHMKEFVILRICNSKISLSKTERTSNLVWTRVGKDESGNDRLTHRSMMISTLLFLFSFLAYSLSSNKFLV